MTQQSEKIPVSIRLPDGTKFERDDIAQDSRIDRGNLEGEAAEVAAKIARYGYLMAWFNSEVQKVERELRVFKSQSVMTSRVHGVNVILDDGSYFIKAKPSQADCEGAYRKDPQYVVLTDRVADMTNGYELFRGLYYSQRSKSDQIGNLMRMAFAKEK